MSDPAHHADCQVQALAKFFGGRLPPRLGRELWGTLTRRLRAQRLFGKEHAEDVLGQALTCAFAYLKEHGGTAIDNPRAWFHTLCFHAFIRYLRADWSTPVVGDEVLEGKVEMGETYMTDERMRTVMGAALKELSPRFRRFVVLDLAEGLPPEQICKQLHIPSPGAFRKLKFDVYATLRQAIRAELAKDPASIL